MGKTYYYEGMPILAPFTITSNEPFFDMTTVSLKTQRASQGHQRWELSFSCQATSETESDNLLSTFIDFDKTDAMIMPQLPSVAGMASVSPIPEVAVTAVAGSASVYIDSLNAEGAIPKGTFIKFSNHPKVYIVKETVIFAGTTDVLLKIYPNLVERVTTATEIVLNDNVLFSYYKDIDNQTGITFTDGILSNSGTIRLIEAL